MTDRATAPPPGAAQRLGCFLYEGVLLFGVVVIAGLAWSWATQQRHALEGQHGLQAFLFLVIGAYFVWFWTHGGQTLAMKTWHIRLVARDGGPVSPARALCRYLLAWLWFMPALATVWLSGLQRLRLLRLAPRGAGELRRRRPAPRATDRRTRLAAGLRRRAVGLMGEVADATLAAGGRVVGVIPESPDAPRSRPPGPDELHVVQTMHQRKQMMAERADAFIALPGGIGTFEELYEVWTWRQLGYHDQPIGLLNVDGYYDRCWPSCAAVRRGLHCRPPDGGAAGRHRPRPAARRLALLAAGLRAGRLQQSEGRPPDPAAAASAQIAGFVGLAGADAHHLLDRVTKILPSPILPVLAALTMASMQRSTSSSLTTTSTFTLGRKSTTYSAPRYSSVWPFWRPKPLTSVTVSRRRRLSASASRTSSSLKGLMMAVICFMAGSKGPEMGDAPASI
jgi:uncharacterized RDD family membrane protein YckC